MLLKKLLSLSENQLQKFITLLAVLIACQVIYTQHGWINDDSVLYFEMARLFSMGEWKQGVAMFSWPFYPALISAVHQLTRFEIQTSAQVLNVLFFAITTYSFISLIRLAGGNKTTLICGGFLLLSSAYIVGDVLPMLMRDQGFWAAFLTSLVYFTRFYHAGDKVTRRSRTGVLVFLNRAPIVWYSKKQNSIESSTFGSEFTAMKTGVEITEGLRYKLRMMGVPLDGPTHVKADNMSVVKNSSIPESMLKKKSNSIAYHYVRERAASGAVAISYEPTGANVADMLTKIQPGPVRKRLVRMVLC